MDEEIVKSLFDQLSTRVEALERTVNDVIIGGWKKADAEYKDQEAYSKFCEKYGSSLEDLKPSFLTLYGEDYDLPKEMYKALKEADGYGSEDFDEETLVNDKINELREKFKMLKEPKEVEVEIKEEPAEVEPAEVEPAEAINADASVAEDLNEIFKQYVK